MLKIWGRPNSINVQKVMWTVAELGLEFERVDVGGPFGGLGDPAYLRLNPHGLIPTIEDGDAVVWESNAIVRYLAARYGQGGLWDDDPARRARSDGWMDWQATIVSPQLSIVLFNLIRLPEPERDLKAASKATDALNRVMGVLDDWLDGKAYVAGDGLGIGDIAVGAAVYRYLNLPIERPERPAVRAYFERLAERPAFAAHVMLPLT